MCPQASDAESEVCEPNISAVDCAKLDYATAISSEINISDTFI